MKPDSLEDLTEEELIALKKFYLMLSELAERESDLLKTHTIEEASSAHTIKLKDRKNKVLKE